jgi:hypothetical protein
VTVAVEGRQAERAAVIPGERSAGVACTLDSVAEALRDAEALVLSRGACPAAEAKTVAGSPAGASLARRMLSERELLRYVHLGVRHLGGG